MKRQLQSKMTETPLKVMIESEFSLTNWVKLGRGLSGGACKENELLPSTSVCSALQTVLTESVLYSGQHVNGELCTSLSSSNFPSRYHVAFKPLSNLS